MKATRRSFLKSSALGAAGSSLLEGPGLGRTIDPDFVKKHSVVTA